MTNARKQSPSDTQCPASKTTRAPRNRRPMPCRHPEMPARHPRPRVFPVAALHRAGGTPDRPGCRRGASLPRGGFPARLFSGRRCVCADDRRQESQPLRIEQTTPFSVGIGNDGLPAVFLMASPSNSTTLVTIAFTIISTLFVGQENAERSCLKSTSLVGGAQRCAKVQPGRTLGIRHVHGARATAKTEAAPWRARARK